MATADKVKSVFEYYNVNSEVDSEFGDWVVSKEADVINVEKAYPIYTYRVENESVESWLDHMREKSWFDEVEDENFQKAYKRAEEILGK